MDRDNDKQEGGNALPDNPKRRRLVGVSPSGMLVNNVTKENQADVAPRKPWLYVEIWDEDLQNVMFPCYIPNTRKRPGIIIFGGIAYEAWDTTKKPPQYRKCLVATAISTVEKDKLDAHSRQG
jgi:hypothetical protein